MMRSYRIDVSVKALSEASVLDLYGVPGEARSARLENRCGNDWEREYGGIRPSSLSQINTQD